MADETPRGDARRDEGDGLAEYGPLVDEALARLGAADRDAVVWRFVDGLTFAQVGARQGTSDEAARKRVARAIDRVRSLLARRGVHVADVAATLAAINVNDALPATLRATMSDATLTSHASPASTLANGAIETIGKRIALRFALAAVLATAAVIAARPRDAARAIAATTTTSTVAATPPPATQRVDFGGGVAATVLGVRYLSDGNRPRWWSADGTPLAVSPASDAELHDMHQPLAGLDRGGPRAFGVLVVAEGISADAQLRLRYAKARWGAAKSWRSPAGTLMHYAVYTLADASDEARPEVGLMRGAWEDGDVLFADDVDTRTATLAAFPPPGNRAPGTTLPTTRSVLSNIRATANGKTAVLYVDTPYWAGRDNYDWRTALVTRDGRTITRQQVVRDAGRTLRIFDVPFDDVAAAVHQTRAIEWRSLGTIRLAPASRPATGP